MYSPTEKIYLRAMEHYLPYEITQYHGYLPSETGKCTPDTGKCTHGPHPNQVNWYSNYLSCKGCGFSWSSVKQYYPDNTSLCTQYLCTSRSNLSVSAARFVYNTQSLATLNLHCQQSLVAGPTQHIETTITIQIIQQT